MKPLVLVNRYHCPGLGGRSYSPSLVDASLLDQLADYPLLVWSTRAISWYSWQICFWSSKIEEKQGLKLKQSYISSLSLCSGNSEWFSVHYHRVRGEWPSRSISQKGCKRHNFLTTVATIGSGKHYYFPCLTVLKSDERNLASHQALSTWFIKLQTHVGTPWILDHREKIPALSQPPCLLQF